MIAEEKLTVRQRLAPKAEEEADRIARVYLDALEGLTTRATQTTPRA